MKAIGKSVAKGLLSVLAGIIVGVGGLYGAGLSSAASDDKPAAQETAGADQPQRPGPLKGALHAGGSTRTFAVDRGQIARVEGGTITIERRDGESVAAPTNEDTCIRKDGEPATVQDLAVGSPARVAQEGGTAVAIRS